MKPFLFHICYLIIITGFVSPYFGRPELANVSLVLLCLAVIALVAISFLMIGLAMLSGHSYEKFHQTLKERGSFSNVKKNSAFSKWVSRFFDFALVCATAYAGYVAIAVIFVVASVFLYMSVKFLEKTHEDWLETQEVMNTWRDKVSLNLSDRKPL